MKQEAYPLSWPDNYPRKVSRARSRFRGSSVNQCWQIIDDEVRKMGGKNLIISSNLKVKNNGVPYSAQKDGGDPGVAVYFDFKERKVCMACDTYRQVWENTYAIAQTIRAMRACDRWGVSGILDRLFIGFVAITDDTGKPWHSVLRCSPESTPEEIKKAYRKIMKEEHPDISGDNERAIEINQAYEKGMKEAVRT